MKLSAGYELSRGLRTEEFRRALTAEGDTASRAEGRIASLTKLGFCDAHRGVLIVREPIRQAIVEYREELKRDYDGLRKSLKSLTLREDPTQYRAGSRELS